MKPDVLAPKPAGYIKYLLVPIFALFAIFGAPFIYDHGNSGRYILIILKMVNPALFPNDAMVDNIARFKSLFYVGIGDIFKTLSIGVQHLEPFMYGLFIVIKVLLVWVVWKLSAQFKNSWMLFMIFMAWACFPENAPIGGESAFKNEIIHSSLAEILCLGSLVFALQKRYTLFWMMLAIGVLIHSLIVVHFLLCIGLPIAILGGKTEIKNHVAGVLIFISALAIYVLWFAPPALSAEEAKIFISAKGDYCHISPFTQEKSGWLNLFCNLVIVFMSYRVFSAGTKGEKLILYSIISGIVLALVLGFAAVHFRSITPLSLLQPMRTFTWIHVFVFFLLAYYAIEALMRKSFAGILLLAFIGLSTIESFYALFVLPFLVIYLIAEMAKGKFEKDDDAAEKEPGINGLVYIVFALFLIGILAGWLLKKHVPGNFAKNPLPLAIALVLLGMVYAWWKTRVVPAYLYVVFVGVILLGASFHWHWYYSSKAHPQFGAETYKARIDANWEKTERWIAANTDIKASVLLANPGENFRTIAMRSCVGESMPALAWVAPKTYLSIENQCDTIKTAFDITQNKWDMMKLQKLAAEWHNEYILVKGDVTKKIDGEWMMGRPPVFTAGDYKVFDAKPVPNL